MYRLEVQGLGCASMETIRANAAYSASLGIPEIERSDLHKRPLSIVGGGPSAHSALPEIGGDVWAINGACQWLASKGIESTLFSVDPDEGLTPLTRGVKRAILASHCHPKAFDALLEQDACVRIFHAAHIGGLSEESRPMALRKRFRIATGTTSACSVPCVALRLGYQSLTYYGCEGSFTGDSHTFKSENNPGQVIVRAGSEDYRTTLQFYLQCQQLSGLLCLFPNFMKERSGGLLRAMVEHRDTWEVVALSESLRDALDPSAITRYEAA